jgi:hypothetical protein
VTIHQRKLLILIVMIVATIGFGLNLGFGLMEGWRQERVFSLLPPAAILLLCASIWRRLSKQEARLGGDYVLKPSPGGRRNLLFAALAALVAFGGGVAFVLLTRR